MSQRRDPMPPFSAEPTPTVAEAKARLLACGERTGRELEEAARRLVAQAGAEIRRSAVWLPLAALGIGTVFGGRSRRRRRGQAADPATPGPAADPYSTDRSRWFWRVAPVVVDLLMRSRGGRRT